MVRKAFDGAEKAFVGKAKHSKVKIFGKAFPNSLGDGKNTPGVKGKWKIKV